MFHDLSLRYFRSDVVGQASDIVDDRGAYLAALIGDDGLACIYRDWSGELFRDLLYDGCHPVEFLML